jgi:HPt (histidine-containing phosphotransfer) domain-containing protein
MTDEVSDKLAALRPGYLRRLAERYASLKATIGAMMDGPQSEDDAEETHRLVHSMGSSAAIYGYRDLSEAARAAERQYDDPAISPAARLTALRELTEEVRRVLEKA